jgi:uncharacterized repeat protein (TIGR03803 family)
MLIAVGVAPAQMTEVVLYSFTGGADGANPYAGVTRDSSGNLYGTTSSGARRSNPYGGVYKLDSAGHFTALANLPGITYSGVVRDPAGNLYGAAQSGFPIRPYEYGFVYEVETSGKLKLLLDMNNPGWALIPTGGLLQDSAGNLYGTSSGSIPGPGALFKISPSDAVTEVYGFAGGAAGAEPWGRVIRDSAGNFYGTAKAAGQFGHGVVYKVDTAHNETVLHNFTGGADGANPVAGLVRDSIGNLYGATPFGGTSNLGVVYRLDSSGNLTVLHTFTGGADGANPQYGSLVRDSAGNLYGTASNGGASNAGVVYKVYPSGNETVLYTFTGGADGAAPYSGVIRDKAGNLYGTTYSGGAYQKGTIFELKP